MSNSTVNISKGNRDALERYPWLEKMFHFTSIDLEIEDRVKGGNSAILRSGVKHLKIFPISVTSKEDEWQKIEEAMKIHQLAECHILNKDGKTMSGCYFESQLPLGSDTHLLVTPTGWNLADVAYYVLSDGAQSETVVVYEITR